MPGSPPPYRPKADLVARGVKRPSPLGTATFIGLRALDPFLQYRILAHGLGTGFLAKIGLSTIPLSATVITRTGFKIIDQLGLPLERLLLLGMAVGSAAKQIFWVTYLSQEELQPKPAVIVSAFNSLCNSANSLLLLTAATSAALSTKPLTVPVPGTHAKLSLPVAVGTVMYVVGILLETAAELQRKRFKDNPEHKGRLCREGLWSWARHINYTGYTLWRGGYALAAGGWVAGVAMVSFQAHNFIGNGIVSLDYYMSRRYKDQWGRYKEDVKWKLVPGLY
ncbi:hypothetical protein N8I77_000505 [Diaporthe amygdali]|uniref:Steroid 5-alpha reductase C-terminal domain-containing protein n=1 Tax=Phomopsis amygdali TaxID=1214568 RepID=A0AAD9SNY4_PHOAM|nr:hypothetical protein N8I77_000505 [Diaporthe amygdali]